MQMKSRLYLQDVKHFIRRWHKYLRKLDFYVNMYYNNMYKEAVVLCLIRFFM